MDLGLKNKVAFIAASSDGLGKAVAIELAKEGATIIINGRNKAKLENTRNDIEQTYNTKVLAVSGDLAKEDEREIILKTIFNHHDKVDILITNTGGPPSGKFEDLSMEDWDNTYKLLLASTVALIKAILPGMKQQQWGRIIAITSQAVKQPVDNLILSNSVRASVAGLIKTLASELGEHSITVNNVMPGYTKTNRLLSLIESNPSFKSAIDEIPLKRFGNPEEFAAAVTFLASERASYITGTSLAVDGGWIKHIL
ncbi:SDR family oxidoreductase [Pontimicrobium aquaticum]|uniref:SDR family oxidoreductase n=1 Tax=Pontimicrobium aquaticum TaxID=2565367 RepID=A0A4U0EP14_9FLAO|nr:SDR family oxidoreductase [Pontimicrobium aquaticum]TJY33357.1 SDR family oxidoreductase [Pontimicrobium aquaticum]